MQGKRWIFVINNYTNSDVDLIKTWGIYGMCNYEVGETNGTPHLQGLVVFQTNQRLTALKKLHATCHFELMKGTLEQAETYCSKPETRAPGTEPFTWGERPVNRQGARTDLQDAIDAMEGAASVNAALRAALAANAAAFVRYHKGLEAAASLIVHRGVKPRAPPVWKPWQAELDSILQGEPDDRHIYWYTDYAGNAGKSTFVQAYITDASKKAQSLTGKVADMAYMFDEETRVVFFDVTRTQAENMDHLFSFAESLKNGVVHSTKYQSRAKIFDPPHVVFLANRPPPPGNSRWSADRVIEKVLSQPPAGLTF